MDYIDDCTEMKDLTRRAVVQELTKLVRGYVYIIFDDWIMTVKLLDKENELIHEESVDLYKFVFVGFDSRKFAEKFKKNLRTKLNKKYFK